MAAVQVTTTATKLPVPGNGRVLLIVASGNVWWGTGDQVSAATGMPLLGAGAGYELPADVQHGVGALWVISDATGADLRWEVVG